MVWIYCILSVVLVSNAAALPEYHQNDYDVIFERGSLVKYNHSIFKELVLAAPFYNRTMRVLNASFYLLNDMTSNDLVFEIQLSKYLSNEYRYFPLSLAVNICVEYRNNNFNVKEILKNVSNMAPCPLKKGFYYIYNLAPDFSRMPPFIPRGRYKNVGKLYYNQQFVAEAETYFEIVDKFVKWWK